MPEQTETGNSGSDDAAGGEQRQVIDSRFRLVVVAALRSKQLLRGSRARIAADPLRRRNTSIALEEVRRGLVSFTTTNEGGKVNGGADGAEFAGD